MTETITRAAGIDTAKAKLDVDPVSLLAFDKVVMTVDAMKRVEERLA